MIGIPFVCCSYTNCFGSLDEKKYSSVSIDDYAAAYQAVEELVRRGHRRIAAVIPSRNDRSISELRYRGYCDALEEAGIPVDAALTAEAFDFSMEAAYRRMRLLVDSGAEFTALFAIADTMAMARCGHFIKTSETTETSETSETTKQ